MKKTELLITLAMSVFALVACSGNDTSARKEYANLPKYIISSLSEDAADLSYTLAEHAIVTDADNDDGMDSKIISAKVEYPDGVAILLSVDDWPTPETDGMDPDVYAESLLEHARQRLESLSSQPNCPMVTDSIVFAINRNENGEWIVEPEKNSLLSLCNNIENLAQSMRSISLYNQKYALELLKLELAHLIGGEEGYPGYASYINLRVERINMISENISTMPTSDKNSSTIEYGVYLSFLDYETVLDKAVEAICSAQANGGEWTALTRVSRGQAMDALETWISGRAPRGNITIGAHAHWNGTAWTISLNDMELLIRAENYMSMLEKEADKLRRAANAGITLKPVPITETSVFISRDEGNIPFEIVSNRRDIYVRLVSSHNENMLSAYVKAGESVRTHLTPGTFTLLYGYGTAWYGEQALFGERGAYFSLHDILLAERSGDGFLLTIGAEISGDPTPYETVVASQ